MSNFNCLVKHELKNNFFNKNKSSIIGSILQLLISLFFIVIIFLLFKNIVNTYIQVKVNKVLDITTRALEVLNIFNIIMLIMLFFFSLEKQRKMIAYSNNKLMLLRLPIKTKDIFLSKLFVVFISNFIISFIIYMSLGITLFLIIDFNFINFLSLILVSIIISFLSIFIATILVIPYSKLINYLNNQPLLTLIIFILILIGGIYLYLTFLNLVQTLLETGSIKYLFNESFINNMINIYKNSYLINNITNLIIKFNVSDLLISLSILIISIIGILFLSKIFFYKSLYINNHNVRYIKREKLKPHTQQVALIKKELVEIYRNPKQLFLYFAVTITLPVLIIGTAKIFNRLVTNSLGFNLTFEILLLVSMIFISLINSFSSNLISKDGYTFLKYKTYPLNFNAILISKILLNIIVSFIAIIILFILSLTSLKMNFLDSFIIFLILLIFTTSEILFGLKVDLNKTKISKDILYNDLINNRNQSLLLSLYLFISLLVGIVVIILSMLFKLYNLNLTYLSYIIPITLVIIFMFISILYYRYKLQERFIKCGCKEE